MKSRFALALILATSASFSWADAPVEERQVARDPVESAQQKTDFAWKRMREADSNVHSAEQELTEAETAQKEAQKRAQEATKRVENAKKRLAEAKSQQAASREQWESTSSQLGTAWKDKPKR